MISHRKLAAFVGAWLVGAGLVGGLVGCGHSATMRFVATPHASSIRRPALYPESLAWDAAGDRFLVGSFREGAIYAVKRDGSVTKLIDDPRLCSVLGIALDVERGRVWAVSADLGASLKPSTGGPKTAAAVGVYDLATGQALHFVDLAPLATGPHLANGIGLDRNGNAFVTDSFAPVIYRVDVGGHASVFARDPRFSGDGVNLNGVVVHPGGYLLVVKKSDGTLFKVPLAHPEAISTVAVPERFIGGDGLVLSGTNELVIVANQVPKHPTNAVFSLATEDDWRSATVRETRRLGDVYPTGAALRGDQVVVLHSRLNQLIGAPSAEQPKLQVEATLLELGVTGR